MPMFLAWHIGQSWSLKLWWGEKEKELVRIRWLAQWSWVMCQRSFSKYILESSLGTRPFPLFLGRSTDNLFSVIRNEPVFAVCLNFNCGRKRLALRESISSIWEEGKGIFWGGLFLSSCLLTFLPSSRCFLPYPLKWKRLIQLFSVTWARAWRSGNGWL